MISQVESYQGNPRKAAGYSISTNNNKDEDNSLKNTTKIVSLLSFYKDCFGIK